MEGLAPPAGQHIVERVVTDAGAARYNKIAANQHNFGFTNIQQTASEWKAIMKINKDLRLKFKITLKKLIITILYNGLNANYTSSFCFTCVYRPKLSLGLQPLEDLVVPVKPH